MKVKDPMLPAPKPKTSKSSAKNDDPTKSIIILIVVGFLNHPLATLNQSLIFFGQSLIELKISSMVVRVI
ncbi:MAG: hypothetical protein ACTSO7_10170 [Candidatus Heimdallarchaeota archaeon]